MSNPHFLQDVPKTLWPELIRMIAEVIGDDSALSFFIKFNGRRFKVPEKCDAAHLIAQAIGLNKATIFCQRFAGEVLTVPKAYYLAKSIRNRNIIADWKAGIGQQDLATKYDLSYRQVSSIINGTKEQTEC